MKLNNRLDYRKRRHLRLRGKVVGTTERPRMCVAVTNSHIYVQFVDDSSSRTLAYSSTAQLEKKGRNNMETAKLLGQRAAEAARASGITRVVFDRGGHAYHGRVKVIADAAREAGIIL